MNNFLFPRKTNNVDENVFSNRAQNYYPETLSMQESILPGQEDKFDINDLSQFQNDFSYLQNPNQENLVQNDEKKQRKEENFENLVQNSIFSNINDENLNFQHENTKFSSKKDNFSAQNIEEKNENKKNNQKNGINIENIMNFLKNGSQNDIFSSMLASGVFKNQNPALVETLSKMISQKNSSKSKKRDQTSDTDFYEDM